MLELLSDVFGFGKDGITGDAFGLAATEVEKVIAWGMVLEDIGPVEFWVKVPYRCESVGVLRPVPFGKMGSIGRGECDDLGIIEHPKQLGSGSPDEALADLGFVLALGFAEEEDGFHRGALVSRMISRSRYHWAFCRSSTISFFFPARQMYAKAVPRLKVKCSTMSIHSTPLGCWR